LASNSQSHSEAEAKTTTESTAQHAQNNHNALPAGIINLSSELN
jgi:hypothetical protein